MDDNTTKSIDSLEHGDGAVNQKEQVAADRSMSDSGTNVEFQKCLEAMQNLIADFREQNSTLKLRPMSLHSEVLNLNMAVNRLTTEIKELKDLVRLQNRAQIIGEPLHIPDFDFPIQTEESLKLFDQKLLNGDFKKSVVSKSYYHTY